MGQETVISLLLVEDNPGDARMVRELLLDAKGARCAVTWVKTLGEALAQAEQSAFDAVLLDLSLPDSSGMDTIRHMRSATQSPLVVLTGHSDIEVGLNAVKEGCQDYLIKGEGDGELIVRTLLYAMERKKGQDALQRSEERFRELVELSPDAILIYAGDGILFANPSAAQLFHAKSADDLKGVRLRVLFDGEGESDVYIRIRTLLEKGSERLLPMECRMHSLEGGGFDAEVTTVAMDYRDMPAAQVIVRDITARMEGERRNRLAATVFQTSGEAMMVTDANLKIISVNPAFTETTGYDPTEALGRNPGMLSSGRHSPRFYEEMWDALKAQKHWRGELWNRRKDGELYVQRATISVIENERGQVTNYVCVFADITREKRAAEQVQFRATHDALTGLPNRLLLNDRILHALKNAARDHDMVAVLFIDLDGFKPVNDSLGHLVGDKVLQWVADRLRHAVREGDTVARIGGDEFVVVALLAHHEGDAEKVAGKILETLCEPFEVESSKITIGCSIGIAIYPEHGETAETLIQNADEAMYRAKRAGRGRFKFYGNGDSLAQRAAG